MEEFITLIMKNLESNGYPMKRVSFDLEKMYEMADKRGLSFNSVADKMREQGVEIETTTEKVIFSQASLQSKFDPNNISQEMMEQAQEMMKNMEPEKLKEIQDMVANMSPEERAQMMEQAKKMGMF